MLLHQVRSEAAGVVLLASVVLTAVLAEAIW